MPYPRLAAATAIALLSVPTVSAAQTGKELFAQNCAACHQATGKGVPGAFPALDGDRFVLGPHEIVVKTVLNGRGGMPSFRADLKDEEIAAILTYVRSAWSNHATPVTIDSVRAIRGSKAADAAAQVRQAH